ncbi:hypothetical protein BDN72DRAFT_770668 [Pluteus cervinus]|uniref:Uncharacterized protein n=1 Tax=Pluteus cervinus TaxID=181527 RepID=A0ACD3AQE7_9AGAR|nr:hypothetical protein BDN72DRAFT_770668 [Pluteus cervinus]
MPGPITSPNQTVIKSNPNPKPHPGASPIQVQPTPPVQSTNPAQQNRAPRKKPKVTSTLPNVSSTTPTAQSTISNPSSVLPPIPKPTVVSRVRLPHIDVFFSRFPQFNYNPHSHPSSEFQRLSTFNGWDWDDDDTEWEAREARRNFRSALVMQFNATYGTDANSLVAWQELCRTLQYPTIPDTLRECRALVTSTHVNLVDLLAFNNTGEEVCKFPSEVALSEYTIATEKYFPRNDANAGSLLELLLRHILNPSLGRGRRGGGNHSSRRNGGRGGGPGRGGRLI